MSDTQDTATIWEKNIALFSRSQPPHIVYRLKKLHEEKRKTVLITPPVAGFTNLLISPTQMLYPKDALAYSQETVNQYLEKPHRLLFNFLMSENRRYSHLSGTLDIRESVIGKSYTNIPDATSPYLMLFGVGLGFHIPLLLEKLEVRNLIIIEEFAEFLYQSMQVMDWQPIFDTLIKRKGQISFHLEKEPMLVAPSLVYALRTRDFAMADGTFLHMHYQSDYNNAVVKALSEITPLVQGTMGFFEDELLMMTNALGNLTQYPAYLFEPKDRHPIKDIPAFVVGSGPSIDKSTETIKRCKDRAVIFSCGTAIRVLLANGIIPDFHCELENTPPIYHYNKLVADEFDLSKICLLSSNTVDPRVSALYGKHIYFFRDSIVPTRIFKKPDSVFQLAGPTVTNVGCRMAFAFGFYEVYLFGVDLGTADQEQHHSKSSVYGASSDPKVQSGGGMQPLRIPVKGNFVETAYTNLPFLFSRSFFHKLLETHPGYHVCNCSNGVAIEGTVKMDPALLQVNPSDHPRQYYIDEIFAKLTAPQANGGIDLALLTDYITQFRHWRDNFLEFLDTATTLDPTDFLVESQRFLQHGAEEVAQTIEAATRATATGTIFHLMQYYWFLVRRLDTEDKPLVHEKTISVLRDMLPWFVSEMEATVTPFLSDAQKKELGLEDHNDACLGESCVATHLGPIS